MADWIIRDGNIDEKPRYFQPRHDGTAYVPYGDNLDFAIRFRSPVEAELVWNWLQTLGLFQRGRVTTVEDEVIAEQNRREADQSRLAALEKEAQRIRENL